MIDLPANIDTSLQAGWVQVQDQVADYGPTLEKIRKVWDKQSLMALLQGHVFVSDDLMNEAIAKKVPADGGVKAIHITSHENGRMDIKAETTRHGTLTMSGDIEDFVHKDGQSYMVYHVRSKRLPGHGLMSWIFSRVSLGMAQRFAGALDLPEELPMQIQGNRVRIDYSQLVASSSLGQTEFMGHKLADMLVIKGATPKDGGIEFATSLNIPPEVRMALLRMVLE